MGSGKASSPPGAAAAGGSGSPPGGAVCCMCGDHGLMPRALPLLCLLRPLPAHNYRLLRLEDDHAVSLQPYNLHGAVGSWDHATRRSYNVEEMVQEQSLFTRGWSSMG